MNIENITYTTRPLNLGEMILTQRLQLGSMEALAQYIVCRTSLNMDETLTLDTEELSIINTKIDEAVRTSIKLQELSKGLENVRSE